MRVLPTRLSALLADERGVALIEYSSLLLLIAIAAIALLTEAGSPVNSLGNVGNGLD